MDGEAYKAGFTKDQIPKWICPHCHEGRLLLPTDDSLYVFETPQSKQGKNHPAWEFDWINYTFMVKLLCQACAEWTICTGDGEVEELITYDEGGNPEQKFIDVFHPSYFKPSLELFLCPKDTPEDVKEEICQSFELFFCNKSSALSHIRIALEKLLTHLEEEKNSERRSMNLHQRIELLQENYVSIKGLLLAVKELGNKGSHATEEKITPDEVLDVYELMEFSLKEIYANPGQRVEGIAVKINKNIRSKKALKVFPNQ